MNINRSRRSPHKRRRVQPCLGVVIHYTGGNGALAWMCDERSEASAHYYVSRKGGVWELVPPSHVAFHAGVSEMMVDGECLSDANDFTIGIELDNLGPQEIDGETVWEKYPEAQLKALESLLAWLRAEGYGEAVDQLVGHEEIAMPRGRKSDPGPAFPWERFRREPELQPEPIVREEPDDIGLFDAVEGID